MTGPADTAAAGLRAWHDAHVLIENHYDDDLIQHNGDSSNSCPGCAWQRAMVQVFADLRAVLDEREQLEQQRDEARMQLTGAQARLDYLDGRRSVQAIVTFAEQAAEPKPPCPWCTSCYSLATRTDCTCADPCAAEDCAFKLATCDRDCDCDCQPGQPCLCPERDCYCGPCPVCGPAPATADNTAGGRAR